MQFQDLLNDAKLAGVWIDRISADGATDVLVRVQPEFIGVDNENYAAIRAQALGPAYAKAMSAGISHGEVEAYCFARGIARPVLDVVVANFTLTSQLTQPH